MAGLSSALMRGEGFAGKAGEVGEECFRADGAAGGGVVTQALDIAFVFTEQPCAPVVNHALRKVVVREPSGSNWELTSIYLRPY